MKTTFKTLTLLALFALTCVLADAGTDALEQVIHNIENVDHMDSELGVSPHDVGEEDYEMMINNEENFGIQDIDALLDEIEQTATNPLITKKEKKRVEKHLLKIQELKESHQGMHEELNEIIKSINQVNEEIAERTMGIEL